jgi:hypothetical protein
MRVIASTARPTSTRAWYGRHARCAAVRLRVAWRSGATRRQGLGCPRWRGRSLARVRAGVRTRSAREAESHPGGRAYICWTRRAEGFDSSGVRVCIWADVGGAATGATQNRRHVHDDDTETRAQRADLGEAVIRVEVAERSELGVDGSTDTRAPVRWGSRRRHGGTSSTVTDRWSGARPLGCMRMCACQTPTARPWQRHEIDGVH